MISIVVSWRDRKELAQALPGLCATARLLDGDLTIVNFGGSPAMIREQISDYADQLDVVQVDSEEYFNKARAQNLGAGHTDKGILFFCDCDIVLDPRDIQHLAEKVLQHPSTFATLARTTESEVNSRRAKHVVCFGYELRIRTADGRALTIVDSEEDATDGGRNAPGLLLVRRSDFAAIRGYNSRLHGWGWEDQDIIARLTLGAGLERIIEGSAIHISHDDEARTKYYPVVNRWESRDKMFRQALANYDNSDFRGTLAEDLRNTPTVKLRGSDFFRRLQH